MRSKTLYFNGTLFRKNLSRFWPLWGGAAFLGSLFPLAMLLNLMSLTRADRPAALDFTGLYYETLNHAVPVISLLYAILCAMAVWSYLYNSRSVGLLHTLPIRREGLFLTNLLSGMAMMLIPYAVVGTLCLLISAAFGALDMGPYLVTVLGVAGESLFFFASATLAAMVVGNLLALPALYLLLHFLAVLLEWLFGMLAQGFLFGLESGYQISTAAAWLSPVVGLMEHVDVERTYQEVPSIGGGMDMVLQSVSLEKGWVIGVYALAGAVLLALAWLLYRRRRSESAGDVVAVGALRPLFRYGLAALAALVGGVALYELVWRAFRYEEYYEAVPMAVCMLIAGAIGYYAASMLLAKSLRVFRGSWKGLALVAAGCAAVCCVLHFDLLHVEDQVPQVQETETLEFRVAGNSYTLYGGQDDALMEQLRQLHQAIVAEEGYIVSESAAAYDAADPSLEIVTWTGLRLEYTLKNGDQVRRWYSVPLTRDRMDQPETYDGLMDALVNGEELKNRRLHRNDPNYQVVSGELYLNASRTHATLGSREAASILEAVYRDCDSGAWGTYDWFGDDNGDSYAMDLNLEFLWESAEADGRTYENHDGISIQVRPGMDHTVETLRKLGLVQESDLVTYRKLYPEEYPAAEAAAEDRIPADVPAIYEHENTAQATVTAVG
jgi:ABC-2 type transport system permease protein